jgi:putative permease
MLLAIGLAGILILGDELAPVFASVVIAYLLEGIVSKLERFKMPRIVAVLLVFFGFLIFFLFLLLRLLPLLWQQIEQLFQQLPVMISWGQRELLHLPERYPDFITEQQVVDIMSAIRSELANLGQRVFSFSLASAQTLITFIMYAFIVPFLVFFFLKDKDRILAWIEGLLPKERSLATEVWRDVDRQIGNYIRGKVWEILILWAASYLTFTILQLELAMLISFLIGLSVLVPYIGATVMALPVASVAFFQWGWGPQFVYANIAYLVLQILDGNVLAPVLFSEVVNLHPIVIVAAILLFGGVWGFWGIFFAIPLATLVDAVVRAWYSKNLRSSMTSEAPE